MYSHNKKKGFSVVEILVASAIIATIVTAVGGGWQIYLKTTRDANHFTMAANMTEEGTEAIQLMRDSSWTANIEPLSLGTTYDLYWDSLSSSYKATTSSQIFQNQYRRTITLSSVERDAWDNIVTSGGTIDTKTRKVTMDIYLVSTTSKLLSESETLIHNTYAN
jgi:prepilin-type N-terminal cleavage/methylation domain-containing protein